MNEKLKTMLVYGTSLLAVVLLFLFIGLRRSASVCNAVQIEITGEPGLNFISRDEVASMLKAKGFKLKDERATSINLMDIEKELMTHPAVLNAEAFFDVQGNLVVRLEQRTPILRVFDSFGDSYYIDIQGEVMPLISGFTARIPVATGFIQDKLHTRTIQSVMDNDSLATAFIIDDLFAIALAAKLDTFIWAQLEQLNVLPDGDIEFIPAIGPGRIMLGDASQIEDKFKRLKLFYDRAIPKAGWNAYSALNLKYNNQIICTQNN